MWIVCLLGVPFGCQSSQNIQKLDLIKKKLKRIKPEAVEGKPAGP